MQKKILLILIVLSFTGLKSIFSQSYSFFKDCEQYLKLPYVSDGQDYFIELRKGDKGEFKTTFYGGSKYRIITCSNLPQGNLIFNIFDTEKNLLYSNVNFDYTPYWDFIFRSTIDCIIEVKFESEIAKKVQVKLIIAFKN